MRIEILELVKGKEKMGLQYNIYFGISAIMMMVILVVYSKITYSMESMRNREFYKLTLYVLFTDILDVVTAVTISYAAVIPRMANIILNTLYFGGNSVMCYQFLKYSALSVHWFRGEVKVSTKYRIIMSAQAVLLLLNIFSGWMFDFDASGNYIHGPLYMLTYIVPYACFFLGILRMVKNIKEYSIKQRMSIFSFSVIALAGAVLQLGFFPQVLFTSFSLSIGLIIVMFSLETPDYQKLMKTMDELKLAKEEAEEAKKRAEIANQAKSTFLANMSHEIRTPINAVIGMNEMILRESNEPDILEYAHNIQSASSGLLALINDILDISKIESGKMELVQAEYSLFELVKACYNMIEVQMKEKKLDFTVECEKKIPERLYGDEMRIRQIIFNLLTNAYKYTKEGKVVLRIKQKKISNRETMLLITVEDTGIGISKENLKHLFANYERIDEINNHNIEGTGLGLSITKQLVELMHGEIGVNSTLGKGSLFYVELPQRIVDMNPVGDFYERYSKVLETKKYREKWCAPNACILVVDDVETNLLVVKNLLKNTGIRIDTADSGVRCLELAAEHGYHLILLDHMMPEMDGVETLHRLKEQDGPNKNTPVVVSTANAIAGVQKEYLDEGFDDYISKPATGQALEEMVLKYLPQELIEMKKQ